MTEAIIEPNPNIHCLKRPSGQVIEVGEKVRGWLVIAESTLETPAKGRKRWIHGCGTQVLADIEFTPITVSLI